MGCCGQGKRLVTAAGAVGRVIVAAMDGRPVRARPDTIKSRTPICQACPHYEPWEKNPVFHRCKVCGCWLDGKYFAKINLATESCPEDKWRVEV